MYAINTILYPTDFSPPSEAALHLAVALARDYGAKLILLHVLQTFPVYYGDAGLMVPPVEEDRGQAVEQLKGLKVPSHILTECLVRDGDPAEEILAAAKELNASLIVLGTHGRTGLGRLLIGSVAETVLRKAACPVLTVRAAVPELPKAEFVECETAAAE